MTKYLLLSFWNYEKPEVLALTSSIIEVKQVLSEEDDVDFDKFSMDKPYKTHSVKELSKDCGGDNFSMHQLYKLCCNKNDIVALTIDTCDNNDVITASDNNDLMQQIYKNLYFLSDEDKEKLMSYSQIFDKFDQVIIEGGERFIGHDAFCIEIKVLKGDFHYHDSSFKITI